MDILYMATATSTGNGRNGHVRSDDGVLDFELRTPTAMGGAGQATNPEQLFAAGYSACFHSALKGIAAREKLDATGSEVTAKVGLGKRDEGGYGLAVELDVHVPGIPRSAAEELAAKAHQVCPYSNATRGNVEVTLVVA
jgi:osmotically inducible protein OsmC